MNDSTTNKPAEHSTSSVVKLAPSSRVIGQSPSPVTLRPVNGGPNFIRVPNQVQGGNYLPFHLRDPDSAVLLPSKKIPRPPNAFMMFANEWRKKLAIQHPAESNKSISVRLGQLWKNMGQNSKDVYFQLAKEAGRDHKKKYPGYVYNPKEARMRKALREQTRGSRSTGNDSQAGTRWPKYAALTMNHQRQSLLSPVLLQHSALSEDSKSLLQEPDSSMLQSYPDYLELPYNVPSTDYSTLDNQSWYPYIQSGAQSNGGYMERTVENKLPIDWSTPYNSEQGNFIRASPQSSPYSMQNHQEIPSMLMNGEHSSGSGQEQTTPCEANCLAVDCKPVIDQLICQNTENCIVKDPEQQVKELLASAKVIPENSPVLNGGTSSKQENHIDSNSTRLPGFHQAFGSTEIGRFSQPDGFFEAAVAAENERKLPCDLDDCTLSLPNSSPHSSQSEGFGFQVRSEPHLTVMSSCFEPNHLYTINTLYSDQQIEVDQSIMTFEDTFGSGNFESQDLSDISSIGKPPVIISENDNCCVIQLESSAMDSNNVKEYFSL